MYIYFKCVSIWDFSGSSDGKESTCIEGDLGLILGRKIPWRRDWLPTPVFVPGEFQGQEPGRLRSIKSHEEKLGTLKMVNK